MGITTKLFIHGESKASKERIALDTTEKKITSRCMDDYLKFIRNHFCCKCGGMDDWDGITDNPLCTVSHVKTRGSGGKDWKNVVPMCWKCHMKFERLPGFVKRTYYPLADMYAEKFLEYINENWPEIKVKSFLGFANGIKSKLYRKP